MREWIQKNGHNRGMVGKKHSEKTKQVLAEQTRARWKDPNSYQNQDAYRQLISDRFSRLNAGRHIGHTRCHGGRRTDLGNRYFRSAWEANYARYLNFLQKHGNIFKWEYEPDTFWFEKIKRGTRSYTPDFKVWNVENGKPHYEEVKGWLDKRSKIKLERMKKYHPEIQIVLVGEKQYRAIARSIKPLIPEWE